MRDRSVCKKCGREFATHTDDINRICLTCDYAEQRLRDERPKDYINQMEVKRKASEAYKNYMKKIALSAAERAETEQSYSLSHPSSTTTIKTETERVRKVSLEEDRRNALNSTLTKIWDLYYITHIDNLLNIITRGIFSHDHVEHDNIPHTRIGSRKIEQRRNKMLNYTGHEKSRNLNEFAHVFFFPRNSFLYRVINEQNPEKIVVIKMRLDISGSNNAITLKNAAASDPTFHSSSKYSDAVPELERIKEK